MTAVYADMPPVYGLAPDKRSSEEALESPRKHFRAADNNDDDDDEQPTSPLFLQTSFEGHLVLAKYPPPPKSTLSVEPSAEGDLRSASALRACRGSVVYLEFDASDVASDIATIDDPTKYALGATQRLTSLHRSMRMLDVFAPSLAIILVGINAVSDKEKLQLISDYFVNAFMLNSTLNPSVIPNHEQSLAFFPILSPQMEADETGLRRIDAAYQQHVMSLRKRGSRELSTPDCLSVDACRLFKQLQNKAKPQKFGLISTDDIHDHLKDSIQLWDAVYDDLSRHMPIISHPLLGEGMVCIPALAEQRACSFAASPNYEAEPDSPRLLVTPHPISKDVLVMEQDHRNWGFLPQLGPLVALLLSPQADATSGSDGVKIDTASVSCSPGHVEFHADLGDAKAWGVVLMEQPELNCFELMLYRPHGSATPSSMACRSLLIKLASTVREAIGMLEGPLKDLEVTALLQHGETSFANAERAWERLDAQKRYMRASTEMIYLDELVQSHPLFLARM